MLPQDTAVLRVSPEQAEKSENRRDWAMVALFGGGVVMTAFAAVALYLLRANPEYVFYLGLAAHIQIVIVMTALAGLLVKRSLKISKGEISFVDHIEPDFRAGNPHEDDLVIRGDVKKEVEAAVEEAPAVDVPTENTNGSTNQPSGRNI